MLSDHVATNAQEEQEAEEEEEDEVLHTLNSNARILNLPFA